MTDLLHMKDTQLGSSMSHGPSNASAAVMLQPLPPGFLESLRGFHSSLKTTAAQSSDMPQQYGPSNFFSFPLPQPQNEQQQGPSVLPPPPPQQQDPCLILPDLWLPPTSPILMQAGDIEDEMFANLLADLKDNSTSLDSLVRALLFQVTEKGVGDL